MGFQYFFFHFFLIKSGAKIKTSEKWLALLRSILPRRQGGGTAAQTQKPISAAAPA